MEVPKREMTMKALNAFYDEVVRKAAEPVVDGCYTSRPIFYVGSAHAKKLKAEFARGTPPFDLTPPLRNDSPEK